MGELAVRAVDLAPLGVQLDDRGPLVFQDPVYRPTARDRVGQPVTTVCGVAGPPPRDPVLIHQALYRPPFDSRVDGFGFSGFQYVYEPSKSSELQYWCQHLP